MKLPDLDTKYMLREMTSISTLIKIYEYIVDYNRLSFDKNPAHPSTPTMTYILACGNRIISDEAFSDHQKDIKEYGEDIVIGFPSIHEYPCDYTNIRRWCDFGRKFKLFDKIELNIFKNNIDRNEEFLHKRYENDDETFDKDSYISDVMSKENEVLIEEFKEEEFNRLLKLIKK